MEQTNATQMLLAVILMAHTTVRVCMVTVETDSIAQVIFRLMLVISHQPLNYPGINLCEVGSTDCHTNATCLDRDGGYDCECNDGYTGNGTHCEGMFLSH